VDPAIVSFWKSFRSWRASEEGTGGPEVVEERDDYLERIGAMPRSRGCVACLSADAAVRRFAPLALEAGGRRDLAAKLRELPAVRTPKAALAAYERVADVLEATRADARAAATRTDVIETALESLLRASKDGELRANEHTGAEGRWCIDFEALSEYEDKTMETLARAVNAGVPKSQGVREAQALLKALARFGQRKHSD